MGGSCFMTTDDQPYDLHKLRLFTFQFYWQQMLCILTSFCLLCGPQKLAKIIFCHFQTFSLGHIFLIFRWNKTGFRSVSRTVEQVPLLRGLGGECKGPMETRLCKQRDRQNWTKLGFPEDSIKFWVSTSFEDLLNTQNFYPFSSLFHLKRRKTTKNCQKIILTSFQVPCTQKLANIYNNRTLNWGKDIQF